MLLILGLGTNLGDRLDNLQQAKDHLLEYDIFNSNIQCSSIFETKAILKENSPPEWNIDFFNMNISGNSNLDAHQILDIIKNIENIIGRNNTIESWAPRIIDIDILLYGDLTLKEPHLQIPHKELNNRPWCLSGIVELHQDAVNPEDTKLSKYSDILLKYSDLENIMHKTNLRLV